jgi:hypothetical protein
MEMSGHLHASPALSPYPLNVKLGGPRTSLDVVEKRKIPYPAENQNLMVHSVASHCTGLDSS